MGESSQEEMPKWLKNLLDDKGFFTPCSNREHDNEGEKENILCVDCGSRLCPLCSPTHPSHRLLQVWRHSEHDSVQVEVFSKLFDLTSIVAYAGNRKTMVFIHSNRPAKKMKRRKQCSTCERAMNKDDKSIIKDLNSSPSEAVYCSLACKIKKCEEEGKLMEQLRECASLLPLPVSCQRSERQPCLGSVLDTTTSVSESIRSGADGLAAAVEKGSVRKKPRPASPRPSLRR